MDFTPSEILLARSEMRCLCLETFVFR